MRQFGTPPFPRPKFKPGDVVYAIEKDDRDNTWNSEGPLVVVRFDPDDSTYYCCDQPIGEYRPEKEVGRWFGADCIYEDLGSAISAAIQRNYPG